jgi:hypothetical protein
MEDLAARGAYRRPTLKDYGDFQQLTGALGTLHVGIGHSVTMAASSPTSPGGAGAVAGTAQGTGAGGHLPASAEGTSGAPGAPGASGGGVAGGNGVGPGGGAGAGGGGGGGNLPFTGLAVGALAAVGGGLAAAGVAVRRLLRRDRA